MSWFGSGFVVAIVAMSMGAWVITTWIRAKHGYPLDDDWTGFSTAKSHKSEPDAERKVSLLTNENERLTGQVSRLEERIAVLERIATDPAERTAREIEALRTKDA
ncbi:MAG: hypothetical protein V4659_07210 [Pseudomonadota bacterium]